MTLSPIITAADKGAGVVDVSFSEDITERIDVLVDGNYYSTITGYSGTNLYRLTGISGGSHTFCLRSISTLINPCVTINVDNPGTGLKYSCVDSCTNQVYNSGYDTKAACLAACFPAPQPIVVTSVTVQVSSTPGQYNVTVHTKGTGSDTILLLIDGVEVKRMTANIIYTPSDWPFNGIPMTAGSHNVCGKVLSTGQQICTTYVATAPNTLWGCQNNCSAPDQSIGFATQAECLANCQAPPPGSFSLTVSKANINKGDSITFTTKGKDGEIKLFEKGILGDTKVGISTAVNGTATFTLSPTASNTYYAMHTTIPGISECGLLCEYSNNVSVDVNNGDWSTSTKIIIAVIVIAIMYFVIQKRL